jgi:hypothetical protein
MISVVLRKQEATQTDVYTPSFFCDHCREPIENVADGLFLYQIDKDGEPSSIVFTVHKACRPHLRVKLVGKYWCEDELHLLTEQLG